MQALDDRMYKQEFVYIYAYIYKYFHTYMYYDSCTYLGSYVPGQCLQQPFEKIREAGKQNQMMAKKCFVMHEKTSRLHGYRYIYICMSIFERIYTHISTYIHIYIFV
jgi:hypothetical protein